MTDLAAYVKSLESTSGVVWVGDLPWQLQGHALRPLWMPHQRQAVNRDAVRVALARTGAAFAQWTEGWDTPPGGWWYICCDDSEYDLGRLPKGPRYDVRRGLDRCEVRRLDPDWFAQNGYPVYQAAFRHYGAKPPLSECGFVDEFKKNARFPGRETWGAFVAGHLAAWESCLVVGDASFSSSARSDPAYFKARPNNALVYVLTRHYLRDRSMKYHSAGARVLLHRTNVQEFLGRMGYRRVYCCLRLEVGWKGRLLRTLQPQLWPRGFAPGRLGDAIDGVKAFALLCDIAHCSSTAPGRGGK